VALSTTSLASLTAALGLTITPGAAELAAAAVASLSASLHSDASRLVLVEARAAASFVVIDLLPAVAGQRDRRRPEGLARELARSRPEVKNETGHTHKHTTRTT